MRDSTPPLGVAILPDRQAQAYARKAPVPDAAPMLLVTAALWAMAWGLWQVVPQTPQPQPVVERAAMPLPVKSFGQPSLAIALAEVPQPKPVVSNRQTQRVRNDILSLFGHVAGTLLRDELDTMVLRLSLGQQVAVHLRRDFLD